MRSAVFCLLAVGLPASAAELSHPPLRPLAAPARRPLSAGKHHFVDPLKGKDDADGSEKAPWRTVNADFREAEWHDNWRCLISRKPGILGVSP